MFSEERVYETKIQELIDEKGGVTIKALAAVFNLPSQRLYTVAKQPKDGEVYDAKVYNWEAIERFLERRLGQEGFPATLEEVVDRAAEIDIELKANDGRKGGHRGAGNPIEMIEVDGNKVPTRKFDNFEMKEDGQNLVVLKRDPNVYKIIFQTRSHTVLRPVADREGTFSSELIKVITNGTFNQKGCGPVNNEAGIEMRFSGEYAEKYPQYMPGYVAE